MGENNDQREDSVNSPEGPDVRGGEVGDAPEELDVLNEEAGDAPEVEDLPVHYFAEEPDSEIKRPPLIQRALNSLELNPTHKVRNFSDNCFCLAVSPNGERAAFCSVSGELLVVDLTTMQELHFFTFKTEGVYSLTWSPTGKYLALGGDDLEIIILDTTTWQPIRRLSGHYGCVQDLVWLPGEPKLVSASMDYSIRVWDAMAARAELIFFDHEGDVNTLELAHDNQFLFTGSQDFKINVYRLEDWELITTLQIHRGPVYALASSPNFYLASSSNDGTVQIISYYDWKPVHLLYFEEQLIRALAWSPCGEFLAVGVFGVIYLVSISLWQIVVEFTGHTNTVESLRWHPDSLYLLSSGRNEEVFIYENPFVKFSTHTMRDFQKFDPGRFDHLKRKDALESLDFRYKIYLKFLNESKDNILNEFHEKLNEFQIKEPDASLFIEHVKGRIQDQHRAYTIDAERQYSATKRLLEKQKDKDT